MIRQAKTRFVGYSVANHVLVENFVDLVARHDKSIDVLRTRLDELLHDESVFYDFFEGGKYMPIGMTDSDLETAKKHYFDTLHNWAKLFDYKSKSYGDSESQGPKFPGFSDFDLSDQT